MKQLLLLLTLCVLSISAFAQRDSIPGTQKDTTFLVVANDSQSFVITFSSQRYFLFHDEGTQCTAGEYFYKGIKLDVADCEPGKCPLNIASHYDIQWDSQYNQLAITAHMCGFGLFWTDYFTYNPAADTFEKWWPSAADNE